MRGIGRIITAIAVAIVAVATVPAASEHAVGATTRAVVVVDTGGEVHERVIEFDGSVTGLEALQLAGANPQTIAYGPLGQAVCALFGVGDAAVPGECPGGWTYYRSVGGAGGWSQSGLGASNTVVHDGDVEGWKYGGGRPGGSPVFCDHVACAPPPEPEAEPAPGGAPAELPSPGSIAGSGAPAGGSGSTGSGPGATSGTAPGAAGSDGTTAAPGESGAAASSGTTGTASSDRRRQRLDERDLESAVAATSDGGDGGSGSPIGVVVAGGVLAAAAVAAVWLRRRRTGPPPGTA